MNFSRKENQSRKVDANSSNEWALIISFVFLAALLGIVATIFPIGFSVKLIMVLLLVVAIPFALMAQSKANAHYKQGFFLLLAWITLHACSPVYLSAKFGSLPDLSPYRLVGWLIMLKVIYWWVASNEFRQIVRLRVRYAQPIFWILLTIILWQIVCSFVGNTPLSSLVFVAKTWFFVPFLFILAISAIRNISDVEKLLILAVLGAVFATLIGVAEWANKDNLFRAFFPVDSERFSAYAWILYDNTRDGVYRVASVFTHPLVFGEYLAVTLPFCLYFIVDSKRRWMRVCALIALSITPIGIYMSHTRSSMIAAIIGLLGFFLARSIVYTRSTIYRMLAITMVLMVACTTIILSSSDISELVKGRTAAERGSSYARKLMFDRALVLAPRQLGVEHLHQLGGGFVDCRPETDDERGGTGSEEAAGQPE